MTRFESVGFVGLSHVFCDVDYSCGVCEWPGRLAMSRSSGDPFVVRRVWRPGTDAMTGNHSPVVIILLSVHPSSYTPLVSGGLRPGMKAEAPPDMLLQVMSIVAGKINTQDLILSVPRY